MTSPSNDFAAFLPFAIRYKVGSSAYMVPEAGQRTTTDVYAPSAGVYQIRLSYTGPEFAEVWWRPGGDGTAALNICKIPADPSGVPRSSKMATIQANGDGQLTVTTTPRPNNGAQPTSTASLHIYPLPD